MMATTAILAGPGDFLPVIFVVIAIASGIINFIKERRANEPIEVGRGDGPPADRGLHSEIDAFLQEISGNDSDSPRRSGQASDQRQRRRKRSRSSEEAERKRRVRARREHDRQEDETAKNRKALSKRHLETNDLSSVSHRHVASSVKERHLEPHIHDLDEKPKRTEVEGESAELFDAESVHALIRQSGSLRNAIVLHEILGPPLARRRRNV